LGSDGSSDKPSVAVVGGTQATSDVVDANKEQREIGEKFAALESQVLQKLADLETSSFKSQQATAKGQNIMTWATVVIAATTIAYAITSYFQLRSMKETGADTHDLAVAAQTQANAAQAQSAAAQTQANSAQLAVVTSLMQVMQSMRLANATADSAKAAKISAVNSGRAVSSADRNLQISLKPSLSPDGIFGSTNLAARQRVVFSDKPIKIYVFMKNTGQSPASVRDFACGMLATEPLPFEIECPRMEYVGEHLYETGGEHWLSIDIPAFSQDDLEAIKTNKKRLYVIFGASYKDQFGNSYHSDYCMMNSPTDDGSWPDCPESHYAREAKQAQKRDK